MKSTRILLIFFALAIFIPSVGFPIENNKIKITKKQLADQVKSEFLHCWEGYKKYAWGYDDLQPLSRKGKNWHKVSLLMTPVDAFSTMKIMGLKKEALEAKELIFSKLSFNYDMDVQFFEINIRLLGGLLSAYQLDGDKRFLILAEKLAKRLIPAFNSPTGMPYVNVNLKTGKTKNPDSNPAEVGTALLEWGTLSKETGNQIYYNLAKKAVKELFDRRSKIGLVGTVINVENGKWLDIHSHLGGRIDSYYEYLLKGWKMFGDKDLKMMWNASIQAINKYLADEVKSGFWYGCVNMNTGKRIRSNFGALDAFFPAVLAMSGDLKRAKMLQESCYKMWVKFDIEPESIDYVEMKSLSDSYLLRPENIESAYYLYHYTGDIKYLKMGEEYFKSLIKYCRNDVAYCQLKSVITKEKTDGMQSFFLAETLKYLFLIFSPKGTIDFDKVVFNTEAHPLKRY